MCFNELIVRLNDEKNIKKVKLKINYLWERKNYLKSSWLD